MVSASLLLARVPSVDCAILQTKFLVLFRSKQKKLAKSVVSKTTWIAIYLAYV